MDRFREELADNDGAGRVGEEAAFGDEKKKDPEQMQRTPPSLYQMMWLNTEKDTKVSFEKNFF